MSSNADLQHRRQRAVARGVAQALDVFAERARGAELWDVEQRRYLDFASGISVLNLGHLHARVVAAVRAQLQRLEHACFQVTPYEGYVSLAERLNALAPGPSPKKTLLLTTGAEAVENALKIARHHSGRSAVLAFGGGFHGRTLAALALTGKVQPYKAGFGPLLPEVYHVPYPMAYHGITPQHSLDALERLLATEVAPERVAALFIEPVLGEGGFYAAPAGFLQQLRALCDRHGILLVADEVQCGLARTGRMFALEHAGVEPDLMTLAKSLGGGLPLAAVVGKAEVMDAPAPGSLGGTFAGSPLACAAALAVLEVIAQERLSDRAQLLGEIMQARLSALQRRCAAIGEVRQLGAMAAIELVSDPRRHTPDAALARAVVAAAGRLGLVILSCGLYGNVIRLLPPLTIEESLLQEGLALLEAALGAAGVRIEP